MLEGLGSWGPSVKRKPSVQEHNTHCCVLRGCLQQQNQLRNVVVRNMDISETETLCH